MLAGRDLHRLISSSSPGTHYASDILERLERLGSNRDKHPEPFSGNDPGRIRSNKVTNVMPIRPQPRATAE